MTLSWKLPPRPLNLALPLALLLALVWPGQVAAHLDLERSEPAGGATLDTPPEAVRLWFNADLDAFESSSAVFDSAGRQVDLEDAQVNPDDRTELRVSLPDNLPPGAYTVRWTAVDDEDGHPVDGQITFTLAGTPTADAARNSTIMLVLVSGAAVGAGLLWRRRRHG